MTLTEAKAAIADRLHHADHAGAISRQGLYLNRSAGEWWFGHDIAANRIYDLGSKGYTLIDWPSPTADIHQEALRLALRLKAEGVPFDPE